MRSIIIGLLLFSTVTWGQTLTPTTSFGLDADMFIGADSFSNLYFIKDMAFYKKGKEGTVVYKDFSLGPIESVDIINPLKIMLYYKQTNIVVFVDNRLNEIERINFNRPPTIANIAAVGNAGNNRLWLFNIDSQQLELYDYRQLRTTQVSQPITGELISLASNFNYCYLLFDDKLITFNIYGSYLSEIEVLGATQLEQHDENVWLVRDDNLYFYAEPGLHSLEKPSEEKKIQLPEITIKQLHLSQDFLYIYNGKKLHTLSITQPKK